MPFTPIPALGRPLSKELGLIQISGSTLQAPTTGRLAWWDANRDLYTDIGLTSPAVNGNSIGGWKDQSGNGLHVTQGTGSAQPQYQSSVAGLNNHPAVLFNAVNSQFLGRTGLAGAVVGNLNTYSMYVVFLTTTVAAQYLYSEGRSTNANPFAACRLNNQAVEGFHRDDAAVSANPSGGATGANGKAHLLTIRRIGASSWAVRQDGVQVAIAANTPTTTTIDQLAIGQLFRNTSSQFFTGYIAQVLLYNSDNFAVVEPNLAAYYGITLP